MTDVDAISGVPVGDPSNASFPAQLTASVEALSRLVVNRWDSLTLRSAAYAASGEDPQVGEVFTLSEDPGAFYVATAADVNAWTRITPGRKELSGQARVDWPSGGGPASVNSRVAIPVGTFGTDRPIVMLTAINGPGGGGMPVVFTLTKNNSDTPSSEVTPTDFGIQGFTIGEGFAGSGVFRYCHFFAVARDLAGSIVATPAAG